MSRFVPQLAFSRFAPATYGVLIALTLVMVSLVVRREMQGRKRTDATASATLPSAPSGSSDAQSPPGPSVPERLTEPATTQAQGPTLDEDPTLPRISLRHAPPAALPSASPVPVPVPRVRSVTGAGLAFPPANFAAAPSEPSESARGAADGARPVAATAEESLPSVVLQVPSLEELPEFPATSTPTETPWSPPPSGGPSSAGPSFAGPSPAGPANPAPPMPTPSAAPSITAPPTEAASGPARTPGVLTFPAAGTSSPHAAEPASPGRYGPPADMSSPNFAAQPQPAGPPPFAPEAPSAPQLPFVSQPSMTGPSVAAQPFVVPPAQQQPWPTPGDPASAAARPTEQQAIPNPWSTFNASASLGRFTEHGTITLADVRLMALQNNRDVAVLGHVPRMTAAGIDAESSVFDPTFNIAASGGHYDRQTATQVESLGSSIPVLKTSFWQPITAPNQVWVDKKFITGGEASLGVGQNYLNYSPAGSFVLVNPSHQASLNLSVAQPLFRGRGPSATMAATEIARANSAQSWHAFQATVNQVLRDAEAAYWQTYAAYQQFEVRDLALAQARQTVERERERLRIGEGSIPDVAQSEEQAESFHIERTRAEIELVQAQRNLRRLMGLPPGDERPLIPATTPDDEPPVVDWESAAAEARNRPEFAAQAAAVEAAEIELRRRKNGLLPDLSLRGIYAVSGLDQQFADAWGTVGKFDYNDWTAGVVYKQTLGRRSDRALEQRAAEGLSMESARLAQLEHEILHQLDGAYKNLQAAESLLDLHRRRREAAAVQLDARRELYRENRAQLRDQLDAEARYASAMLDEALAKTAYRQAVTDWNFARGAMTGDAVLVRQ